MYSAQKVFEEALVLVICNNQQISSDLNTILKSSGLKPVFVSRADKGLSVLRHASEARTPIALVICDYALPDMTGYSFVKTLRDDPTIANNKTVVLTPDHPTGHLPIFSPLGISHILQWPGRSENLIGAIAEYIPLLRKTDAVLSDQSDAGDVQDNSRLRILAADDNTINLAVLKGFLNLFGYAPDTVVNGAEAVKAFKNLHYDLILMDVSMPVMDGVVATLQIREIEKRLGKPHSVPIIAVTAHYTQSQKARYLEAGMNDVIAKPISKAAINDCLQKWCSQNEVETNPRQAFG